MSLSDGFIDPEDLYDSYKSEVTGEPAEQHLMRVGQFPRKKSINST